MNFGLFSLNKKILLKKEISLKIIKLLKRPFGCFQLCDKKKKSDLIDKVVLQKCTTQLGKGITFIKINITSLGLKLDC